MNTAQKMLITSFIILLLAFGLAWYWYGWKLIVVLVLAIWGSRLETGSKNAMKNKQP